MSKKKFVNKKTTAAEPIKTKANITLPLNKDKNKNRNIVLGVSIILTFLIYLGSLNNALITNWDDGGYVKDDKHIQEINKENIMHIFGLSGKFADSFEKGNYHPLTTMVYAFEYSIVKDSPVLYHIINLLLHLINIFLLFLLIELITGRFEIAGVCALFFGIHPMHVESVAWISELKDVMYTMFYLISVIYYFKAVKQPEKKMKYLAVSIISFFLSCLSKSAAVTLPVILVLIDFYTKRKFDRKAILDKIPFFLISLLFGLTAIFSQKAANAIQDLNPMFAFWERLIISSYSLMIYIVKMFVPVQLTAMYPYPNRIGNALPMVYYIAPFVLIGIAGLLYMAKFMWREIIFGSLFFLVSISLVLQILPVGGAILAERYTYVPYIGLFFIVGSLYKHFLDRKKQIAKVILYIMIGFTVFFSYLTIDRITFWKNGETLFLDIIDKYPDLPFAYNNLGYHYFSLATEANKENDAPKADEYYSKSLDFYNHCIKADKTFHRAFSNRGVLQFHIGENFTKKNQSDSATKYYQAAINDFSSALKFKADNTDALIGRANTLSTLNRHSEAIPDYNNYLNRVKTDTSAYIYRGIALFNTKQIQKAEADFDYVIKISPNQYLPYYWKGLVYNNNGDINKAIEYLTKSINIKPDQFESYSWRGFIYFNNKKFPEAISDYNMALKVKPNDYSSLVNRSVCFKEIKDYQSAFNDILKVAEMRMPVNKDYFFEMKAKAGK